MSEATSASNHTPVKESAGIKIGMPKRRPHTNGVLILQLVLLASVRTRIVMLIISDPTADLANGGEFEYSKPSLSTLMSIIQQEGGTSSEFTSTQGELPQETDTARGRGVPSRWLAELWLYDKHEGLGPLNRRILP